MGVYSARWCERGMREDSVVDRRRTEARQGEGNEHRGLETARLDAWPRAAGSYKREAGMYRSFSYISPTIAESRQLDDLQA